MKKSTKWFFISLLATAGFLSGGIIYAKQTMEGNFQKTSGSYGHHGRFMGKLCGEKRNERVDAIVNRIEHSVEMTPEQQAKWTKLTDDIQVSKVKADAACETLKAVGKPRSIPKRLSSMENLMGAGFDIIKQLRPGITDFYQTLSESQQAALERLVRRHHHHQS